MQPSRIDKSLIVQIYSFVLMKNHRQIISLIDRFKYMITKNLFPRFVKKRGINERIDLPHP